MMLMLNVPATFGLFVLATPIVRLLFERGHFLPADTAATAAAVHLYAVGLVGYSAVRIASPTFYAIGESRVPAIVSAGAIASTWSASVALVRMIGFRGLALGTSIAAIVNAVALLWLLRRRLGGLEGRRLSLTFVKVALAALRDGGRCRRDSTRDGARLTRFADRRASGAAGRVHRRRPRRAGGRGRILCAWRNSTTLSR